MNWPRTLRKIASELRHGRPIDPGVRVLAYHGVVERYTDPRVEESFHTLADFRAQLAVLARGPLPVIPLHQLEEARHHHHRHRHRHRRRLPAVAITFDDGFANNLVAAELLADARLPATFFISTGNVTRGEPIWPTLLRLVLTRLADAHARETRARLKRLPAPARIAALAALVADLAPGELDTLVATFPSIAMMTWRDVQQLANAGFEIGSHGHDHELQHADQPPTIREHELVASRHAIEHALGRACVSFAFPNGTTHATSHAEAARAGYARAFTMQSASATASSNPFLFPRLVAMGGAESLTAKLVFGN